MRLRPTKDATDPKGWPAAKSIFALKVREKVLRKQIQTASPKNHLQLFTEES